MFHAVVVQKSSSEVGLPLSVSSVVRFLCPSVKFRRFEWHQAHQVYSLETFSQDFTSLGDLLCLDVVIFPFQADLLVLWVHPLALLTLSTTSQSCSYFLQIYFHIEFSCSHSIFLAHWLLCTIYCVHPGTSSFKHLFQQWFISYDH